MTLRASPYRRKTGCTWCVEKGKVSQLAHTLGHFNFPGRSGIGHTRWATHGRPSEANAHPHTSCDGRIAIVHNGIIENFAELREELIARNHHFESETDSEVLAHLIEEVIFQVEGARGESCDLVRAVREATSCVVGSYGLAVMSAEEPDVVVVTRKGSPIVVGRGRAEATWPPTSSP